MSCIRVLIPYFNVNDCLCVSVRVEHSFVNIWLENGALHSALSMND